MKRSQRTVEPCGRKRHREYHSTDNNRVELLVTAAILLACSMMVIPTQAAFNQVGGHVQQYRHSNHGSDDAVSSTFTTSTSHLPSTVITDNEFGRQSYEQPRMRKHRVEVGDSNNSRRMDRRLGNSHNMMGRLFAGSAGTSLVRNWQVRLKGENRDLIGTKGSAKSTDLSTMNQHFRMDEIDALYVAEELVLMNSMSMALSLEPTAVPVEPPPPVRVDRLLCIWCSVYKMKMTFLSLYYQW